MALPFFTTDGLVGIPYGNGALGDPQGGSPYGAHFAPTSATPCQARTKPGLPTSGRRVRKQRYASRAGNGDCNPRDVGRPLVLALATDRPPAGPPRPRPPGS